MRPLFIILVFIAFMQVTLSQTLKKEDLIIGKWDVYEYTFMDNGEIKHLNNESRTSITEFKWDGSCTSSYYEGDSLVQLIIGNWKIGEGDSLFYFNLTCTTAPNISSCMLPEKIIRITKEELVISSSIFVSRSGWPPEKNKNTDMASYVYYKRIE